MRKFDIATSCVLIVLSISLLFISTYVLRSNTLTWFERFWFFLSMYFWLILCYINIFKLGKMYIELNKTSK